MTETVDDNPKHTLEDVLQQLFSAQMQGRGPDAEEFVKRYPEYEQQIRKRLRKLYRINNLFDTLVQADESDFADAVTEPGLVGQKIGNFEIAEMIGRGGMGIVYLARDTKLKRSVAVKSIPVALSADPTARMRFRREAELLASLNHPNIAVIHEIIEQEEGTSYLVLEYVPGQTLAQRIAYKPLKLEEALSIGQQVAEAVSAAHDKGVVHRDLKPGNIKITPEGKVKVLDFGLAKAFIGEAKSVETAVTQSGRVMGTPAYMSPEQACGKPTDRRSDIWSFGCVLYEMLTGHLPFEGETATEILARIIEREPDWEVLPQNTPANIVVLLRRCLEKSTHRRLRDIGDAAIEISETVNPPATAPPVTPPSISPTPATAAKANSLRIAIMLAAIIIVVLSAITMRFILESRTQPPLEQIRQVSALDVTVLEDISMATISPASISPMAISPDGKHIAFLGRQAGVKQLYLRPLNRDEVIPVEGTDGATTVFFSPASQWLGYATMTRLWKIALSGGQPIPICDVTGVSSAFWAQDDTIIFASTQYLALARVKASGGVAELVSEREGPRELWHLNPEVLPGGKAVIFGTHDGCGFGGFQNVVVQSLVTNERKTLVEGAGFPRYARSGHLVYESGLTMMAAPFDKDTLKTTGPAVRIEGVRRARFSRQGTLAWIPSVPQPEGMLLWVDREGNETLVINEKKQYIGPRVCPDGRRLAFWIGGPDSHVWILDLQTLVMEQLTDKTWRSNWWCSWSPDGSRIAFISQRSEENAKAANLYWKAADGSGPAEQLTHGPFYDQPTSWTPDGTNIIFQRSFHPQTGWDVMLLSLGGDHKMLPLLNSPANESRGELSPDGRWLVYVSTEDGPAGIFVRPFHDPQRKRWRVSPTGISAGDPLWSPDGRELFYRDLDAEKLVVVEVETGDEFAVGTPRVLFDDCYFEYIDYGRTYDITPDGQRFVMVKDVNPPPHRIAVIQNWFEELKRLAPPRKE
ncbi:MAG: protein kinase [Sedimentisphaerales bacterium]|jgi:serine/threonine protein kinase/Tol biopolymer transport system component